MDGFAQSEAVAAIVFGLFVASMTAARLAGTRLIDRLGRVPVLAASGVSSLVGLATFGLAPSLPTALVGVVAWGLGAGLVVPIGMAAVSADPLRAASRVAVVSAFASFASITAPPLIGLAAESMGARHALLLITVVMLVGTLLSRTVREDAPVGTPAGRVAEPAGATTPVSGTVVTRTRELVGAATGPRDAHVPAALRGRTRPDTLSEVYR